ncbi:MAG: hypothetical protein HZC28_09955 [Spirochaetes bacterium]|nr:hypothetical protein [Spirochaetota bacterium]
MKKDYGFTKAVKGRFYIPKNDIELPVYLDRKVKHFFTDIAAKRKSSVSKVVNKVLSKEIELYESLQKVR